MSTPSTLAFALASCFLVATWCAGSGHEGDLSPIPPAWFEREPEPPTCAPGCECRRGNWGGWVIDCTRIEMPACEPIFDSTCA